MLYQYLTMSAIYTFYMTLNKDAEKWAGTVFVKRWNQVWADSYWKLVELDFFANLIPAYQGRKVILQWVKKGQIPRKNYSYCL